VLFATVSLTELINATSGVEKLLLTGVKGVARGADFNVQIFAQSGSGLECVTAAAGDCDLFVFRVYF
jgi:xanthine/uracil/vitamin C permease (AzgA family)